MKNISSSLPDDDDVVSFQRLAPLICSISVVPLSSDADNEQRIGGMGRSNPFNHSLDLQFVIEFFSVLEL